MWNGDNYPPEYIDPGSENGPADDCVREEGHEYQLLTRHADPASYRGVLSNAICLHCSDQAWIRVEE